MLLIFTNSYDGTTDLLIHRLPANSFFRVNCDLLDSYKVEVNTDGFVFEDSLGRRITSHQVKKLYYRKLWMDLSDEESESDSSERFRKAELRYLIGEIISFLWIKGKIVLVEPYAERRCGKLIQLMIAKNYFSVPDWNFNYRTVLRKSEKGQIVKSLSGRQVSKGKVLYTTQINTEQLDPACPWFIQDYVDAVKDLTVVYCRGSIFAYSLCRTFVKDSADWREFISEKQIWTCFDLPTLLGKNIKAYMKHLKLHYGRLDFLLTSDDQYLFCEINPNGQYAWLDLEGNNGLLDCVVSEISPATSLHPIPHACPISSLTV